MPSAGSPTVPPHHQDLPHTRSRPVHWAATAAALAAVLGISALVQPANATVTPQPSGAAESPHPSVAAPDPGAAHYPVECGPEKIDVIGQGSGDLDGDGRPETVALVRCHSGIGTRPSGIYVLGSPAAGKGDPRVVETLLDPKEEINVTDFTVRGGEISATLLGYSSPDVPRCCPDKERKVKWRWAEGKFRLTALPVAGSV